MFTRSVKKKEQERVESGERPERSSIWNASYLDWYRKHSERRVKICEMISDHQSVMKCINEGCATLIYAFDPETTNRTDEYSAKDEPTPKKPRKSRSKIKFTLTYFFGYRGSSHYEFHPLGQTISNEYYLNIRITLKTPKQI